jgi:hypothetical protein
MHHTVLDEKKMSSNVLEKAFFYILSSLFLNWGFCVQKFEKRSHREVKNYFLLGVKN